jgi:hypothetical protein
MLFPPYAMDRHIDHRQVQPLFYLSMRRNEVLVWRDFTIGLVLNLSSCVSLRMFLSYKKKQNKKVQSVSFIVVDGRRSKVAV